MSPSDLYMHMHNTRTYTTQVFLNYSKRVETRTFLSLENYGCTVRPFQARRKRCSSPFCLSKELSTRPSWQLDLCPLQLGLGFIVFSKAERARDRLAKKRLRWAAYNPQNSSPAKRSPCSCSCGVSHGVMSYQHLGPIGPNREKRSQWHSQTGSAVEAL